MVMPSMGRVDPQRGEVWRLSLDPVIGSEISKTRPVVVMSPLSIGRLPLRLVVPITEWQPGFAHFPWMTRLEPSPTNGLHKVSGADAFQTRSVSLLRFVERIGTLPEDRVARIAKAISLCVGYPAG